MLYKVARKLHLYIGIILTITMLILCLTGFYLNHQHDWFHKQSIQYQNTEYNKMIDRAISLEKNHERRLPEAVQEAEAAGLFQIEQINSVNYASHGLGYFYYVHLNDKNQTIIVVTEDGQIAKSYRDPLIKRWMRNLHIGITDSVNFVVINDITAIGMIYLTISGWVLFMKILKAKRKRRSY